MLRLSIVHLDDVWGLDADEREDRECRVDTWPVAELVTRETDPAKVVDRLMTVFFAVRKGSDWSCVEPRDTNSSVEDVVQSAFFQAEDRFYKSKSERP